MSTTPDRLPGSLQANPRLSQWIRIGADGTVTITPGKVEIGQGIVSALAQIAADELDVAIDRIRMVRTTTAFSPNEGVTSGSQSIQESGTALRHACAQARAIYLARAAERLGVATDSLRVEDGEIRGEANAATSYWELADIGLLERDASGNVAPKAAGERLIAGRSVPRLDIPDKVFGRRRFIQDLELPGMLHGRVVRPARPGARLAGVDPAGAMAVPGVVEVVRDGDFLGVIALNEHAALKAHAALTKGATWEGGDEMPPNQGIADWLKRQPVERTTSAEKQLAAPAGTGTVTRTIRHTFTKPYIAHASISPSTAIAQWTGGAAGDSVHVWSHSQGVYNLRSDLMLVLGLAADKVVVEHVEGAGCYGHNAADDVGLDAVLLARSADGRPVRAMWTRADELAWGPLAPAMTVDIEADLDTAGEVIDWRHEIWSNGHVARPGRADVPTLLAASHIANGFRREPSTNPPIAGGGGADRNAIPAYDFPAWKVVSNRLLTMPVRTSAMRSLGAFCNVFAIESFVDEVAGELGEDPVQWRLRHLTDPRARAVVEAAARRAGWSMWKKSTTAGAAAGHGIGYARYKHAQAYCAVVAEVEVEQFVRVKRLVAAVDVGEVINPDGVINQTEGGCIQAASWALLEAVRFEDGRVVSDSWESYPILRFSEVPRVEVEIVARPGERPMGGGEHTMGPVAAAIANAVNDALGVRVTELPITPERIIAAMNL